MPLLQRYILSQLFRVFCGVLVVLTILLVVGGVFQEVSRSGLGVFQTLQILPYIIPSLLPFSIPVAVLLTVCIVYGRMAANHEIVAAKAAGEDIEDTGVALRRERLALALALAVGDLAALLDLQLRETVLSVFELARGDYRFEAKPYVTRFYGGGRGL